MSENDPSSNPKEVTNAGQPKETPKPTKHARKMGAAHSAPSKQVENSPVRKEQIDKMVQMLKDQEKHVDKLARYGQAIQNDSAGTVTNYGPSKEYNANGQRS